MNAPVVSTASPFDAIRRTDECGEYWSARELMPMLGYTRWEHVPDVIERAMLAVNNAGMQAPDHIRSAAKLAQTGLSGVERSLFDYHLTRFGAYMVAMNSDVRKRAVAEAQTYFAVKTREAEVSRRELSRLELIDLARDAEIGRLAAEAKVAELKPAAEAWDHLASTAAGDYSVNEAAKILSRDPGIVIGEGRLWRLLDEWRWTYRDAAGDRRAYQTQVDAGRLAGRARSHHNPRNGELVIDAPQVRVTVKGLADLRKRLRPADGLTVLSGGAA